MRKLLRFLKTQERYKFKFWIKKQFFNSHLHVTIFCIFDRCPPFYPPDHRPPAQSYRRWRWPSRERPHRPEFPLSLSQVHLPSSYPYKRFNNYSQYMHLVLCFNFCNFCFTKRHKPFIAGNTADIVEANPQHYCCLLDGEMTLYQEHKWIKICAKKLRSYQYKDLILTCYLRWSINNEFLPAVHPLLLYFGEFPVSC